MNWICRQLEIKRAVPSRLVSRRPNLGTGSKAGRPRGSPLRADHFLYWLDHLHIGRLCVAALGEGSDEAGVEGEAVPLVVDVDGTLVAGDLLIDSSLRLLTASPLAFLRAVRRGLRGRAVLKRAISRTGALPPSSVVLNPAVVAEIEAAKRSGRPVWLASGADELAVEPLAKRVGADGFLASDGQRNLVGSAKADALLERFGKQGFDYVGNDRRDLPVWRHARGAVAVGVPSRLKRKIGDLDCDARFIPRLGTPLDYVRTLRPHQSVKNALVFVAPLAAHAVDPASYLWAAAAFVILSLVASSGYVLNDIVDVGHDREHPSKRSRPLASGKVRLLPMAGTGVLLAAVGIAASFLVSASLGACAVLYLIAAVAYSLRLKRAIVIDVIVLASLYVVRVVAGGVAAGISVSAWLLAFSLFVFLALAIVKRRTELANVAEGRQRAVLGRGYQVTDTAVITMLGAASAIGAVIVLALYLQSPEVATRYEQPVLLWLACPVLLYWLGRLLVLADRGSVDEDPVVFAVRDRTSWLAGFLVVAIAVIAV